MYLYNYNNHIFSKKIIDKILYTNTDIIIRTNSQIDKREINYSINSDFL